MPSEKPNAIKRRQIYGRQKSRPLSPRQKHLIKDLLPQPKIDPATFADEVGADKEPRTWLEIGFGGGEHLAWQAENHPEIRFIGCEPFINGIAKLLCLIEEKKLSNIRLHDYDAMEVIESLPRASIDRAFVLYPDPWPKKRHHKRRFLSPANIKALANILKPGAELRIATDIGDYARAILSAMRKCDDLVWTAEGPGDWRNRPADWPSTRYEQKAMRAGRKCYYLVFERI